MNAPQTPKGIQKVLGLFSYYRKYIPNYCKIARPLQNLVSAEHFEWKKEQQESFEELKKAITTAPVLRYFDPDLETRLKTDASNYGMGGTLSQIENGEERPVAYISKKLTRAQR